MFPTSFLILVSIIILVVVIVGGMGNLVGVTVGAFVLIGILGGPRQPGLLSEFSEYKLLIYGALLIWMMLQRPEGIGAKRSPEPGVAWRRTGPGRMAKGSASRTMTLTSTPRWHPHE